MESFGFLHWCDMNLCPLTQTPIVLEYTDHLSQICAKFVLKKLVGSVGIPTAMVAENDVTN